MTERTRGTKTSNFGVSKRENHDATAFYARFSPPEVSDDDTVAAPSFVDRIVVGDSRHMAEVADKASAESFPQEPESSAGVEVVVMAGTQPWQQEKQAASLAHGTCAVQQESGFQRRNRCVRHWWLTH